MRNGFDLIRDAYDVAGLDEHERAVLVRLAVMANEGKAWPSIAHLVEKLGKSERPVQRAIRRLVDAGHITQRQRRHDTAIYTVHPILADPRPVSVTGVSVTPVTLTQRDDLTFRYTYPALCDTVLRSIFSHSFLSTDALTYRCPSNGRLQPDIISESITTQDEIIGGFDI